MTGDGAGTRGPGAGGVQTEGPPPPKVHLPRPREKIRLTSAASDRPRTTEPRDKIAGLQSGAFRAITRWSPPPSRSGRWSR